MNNDFLPKPSPEIVEHMAKYLYPRPNDEFMNDAVTTQAYLEETIRRERLLQCVEPLQNRLKRLIHLDWDGVKIDGFLANVRVVAQEQGGHFVVGFLLNGGARFITLIGDHKDASKPFQPCGMLGSWAEIIGILKTVAREWNFAAIQVKPKQQTWTK